MKRALAPLTWWAIGVGYTLALAVIVLPVSWLGTAAYLAASLSLVGATFIAARVHRVNRRFVAAVSAIGAFFALRPSPKDAAPASSGVGQVSELTHSKSTPAAPSARKTAGPTPTPSAMWDLLEWQHDPAFGKYLEPC